MTILYDIIFCLFALVYVPYIIIKKKWHKDFPQRFGRIPADIQDHLKAKDVVWIHAVSVGEVQAVTRLIREMKQVFIGKAFVISTVTTTGNALARKNFSDDVVLYAPLDLSFFIRAYLKAIHPVIYIAAETEIWPNLFHQLTKRNIPIAIVNGRISDKSFGRYKIFKQLIKNVLSGVSLLCMQTQTDAERIIALGAQKERVFPVGNMKFDDCILNDGGRYNGLFQGRLGPVCVAGSTHPGEEEIVIDIFKRLRPDVPDLKCVLVPRHIERAQDVLHLLQSVGIEVAVFSHLSDLATDKDVVLVDTIGHLRGLYALADVVFVGKSLVGRGGQNIIEPASFGKAVIVGPFTENFRSVIEVFHKSDAIVSVNNETELYETLKYLLMNPAEAKRIGQAAGTVVQQNAGATQRTVSFLQSVFPK